MASGGIRPRLPDLEDPADFESVDDSFTPAAQVFRNPPPTIGTGKASKSPSGQLPQPKVSSGKVRTEGDRFELDLDAPAVRAPLATPTSSSLLRDIKENKRSEVNAPLQPRQGTGFPVAQRRPQSTSKPKESRFKASLRQKAAGQLPAKKDGVSEQSIQSTANLSRPSDPLHSEIDVENSQKLEQMSEEEILEAQKELMAMLGGDVVDYLKSRSVIVPEDAATDVKEEHEKARHRARAVRFNEELSYSNPPSRSPSPKPVRKAIPLPAPESTLPSNSDSATTTGGASLNVFNDDPESIRKQYFPNEPLNARLDWMKDNPSPGSEAESEGKLDQASQVRFDLSGQLHNTGPDYHATQGHRHAGSGEKLTLAELLELSKSAVMGQRVLAFQIILKAFSLHSTLDDEATEVLVKSDNVTAIIETCACGLGDKSIGVVSAALALIEQYAVLERTRLNTAAAILTVQPAPLESFSYLLSTKYDLPHLSATSILNILLSLLNTREDFVSTEIVEAPFLLENIGRTFLQIPWPPTANSVLPGSRASELFSTIISMSRSHAEALITRRIEQSVLRYIAVQPWHLESPSLQKLGYDLATSALDVFTTYARYGFGSSTCNTSASLFREIEDHVNENPFEHIEFTRSWLDLLEAWCFCGIDPHSTTPEHDILWAETKEWGSHMLNLLQAVGKQENVPLSISRRLIAAISAWLEGALKHDRPAYDEMVDKLAQHGKAVVIGLVETAAEEPVTGEKAKTLLAIKSFAGLARSDLGDKASILSRIEVEPIPEEGQVTTADPDANDEGWIQ